MNKEEYHLSWWLDSDSIISAVDTVTSQSYSCGDNAFDPEEAEASYSEHQFKKAKLAILSFHHRATGPTSYGTLMFAEFSDKFYRASVPAAH